jgi:hypothetical protein
MITETFTLMFRATIGLVRNWRLSTVLSGIYALLLSTIYLFLTTREASVAQLIFGFSLALAAPLLFFSLQAITASKANESGRGLFLKKLLTKVFTLLLVSIPIIACAILIVYLLSKGEGYFARHLTVGDIANASRDSLPKGIHWPSALIMSLRYLTIGLILPLTLMQFWISNVENGLGFTIRRFRENICRAFRAQSVLIYMSGFLLFGVLPYFILRHQIVIQRPWLELSVFVARLALAFVLTLFGWAVTLRALHYSTNNDSVGNASEVVA